MRTIENNKCGWAKRGDWDGPQEEGKLCVPLQFAQTSENGEREGKKGHRRWSEAQLKLRLRTGFGERNVEWW